MLQCDCMSHMHGRPMGSFDDFGASEFSGGRLTGPLFKMADLGSVLFCWRCY